MAKRKMSPRRVQRTIREAGIFFAVLALLVCGIYVFFYHINHYYVDIRLEGPQDMQLEYGDSFDDPGVTAYLRGTLVQREGKDISDRVSVEGSVDPNALGTYEVKYYVNYRTLFQKQQGTVTRTVTVSDTKAPEIYLATNLDSFTIPGQPYLEEGFSAFDNLDGDVTALVQVREENGMVTYTVTDSSGNQAVATRNIRYFDPIAPEIQLKGDVSLTITQGNDYTEPGYSASDNVDGDLTQQVKVEGSVDTSKPGTYTLTYTVSDSTGNTDTVQRTVKVKEKPVQEDPDPTDPTEPKPTDPELEVPDGEKVVYLTFDDGPGKYTRDLLAILKKYDVKATFFVVKTGYSDVITDIAADGHSIGIHSYTHEFSEIYANEEAYFKDLNKIKQLIYDKTGINTTLVRFPGGSSNSVSKKYNEGIITRLAAMLEAQGYQYFDWNVDSNDAGGAKTADQVYRNVIEGLSKRKTSIVLQHDIKSYSVDAVERIILWGLENGYTFKALDASSPTCHHSIRN